MHSGGIHPHEERLVGADLPLDEVDSGIGGFVVNRLHPLFG
jgi:hypothetical protein